MQGENDAGGTCMVSGLRKVSLVQGVCAARGSCMVWEQESELVQNECFVRGMCKWIRGKGGLPGAGGNDAGGTHGVRVNVMLVQGECIAGGLGKNTTRQG